jgi:hypothetical protein
MQAQENMQSSQSRAQESDHWSSNFDLDLQSVLIYPPLTEELATGAIPLGLFENTLFYVHSCFDTFYR